MAGHFCVVTIRNDIQALYPIGQPTHIFLKSYNRAQNTVNVVLHATTGIPVVPGQVRSVEFGSKFYLILMSKFKKQTFLSFQAANLIQNYSKSHTHTHTQNQKIFKVLFKNNTGLFFFLPVTHEKKFQIQNQRSRPRYHTRHLFINI